MPTTRTRIRRHRRQRDMQPAELEWLTGRPQEGANAFWRHVRGSEKVERCRWLLEHFGNLIPPGRRVELERDLKRWSPRSRNGKGPA